MKDLCKYDRFQIEEILHSTCAKRKKITVAFRTRRETVDNGNKENQTTHS